jgi:hypothetical protein
MIRLKKQSQAKRYPSNKTETFLLVINDPNLRITAASNSKHKPQQLQQQQHPLTLWPPRVTAP